jgi:hypothetical protein
MISLTAKTVVVRMYYIYAVLANKPRGSGAGGVQSECEEEVDPKD